MRDAAPYLERIDAAGAVFVGDLTPLVSGEYLAGTNHVVPTSGTARFSSALSLADFTRSFAVVENSEERAAADTAALAGARGTRRLPAPRGERAHETRQLSAVPAQPIQLVAFDVDGTLVGRDLTISDRVKNAVAKMRESGVAGCLVTGRMYRATVPFARTLHLDSPMICYQGAAILDPATDEVLAHSALANELVRELIGLTERDAMHLQLYRNDEYYCEARNRVLRALRVALADRARHRAVAARSLCLQSGNQSGDRRRRSGGARVRTAACKSILQTARTLRAACRSSSKCSIQASIKATRCALSRAGSAFRSKRRWRSAIRGTTRRCCERPDSPSRWVRGRRNCARLPTRSSEIWRTTASRKRSNGTCWRERVAPEKAAPVASGAHPSLLDSDHLYRRRCLPSARGFAITWPGFDSEVDPRERQPPRCVERDSRQSGDRFANEYVVSKHRRNGEEDREYSRRRVGKGSPDPALDDPHQRYRTRTIAELRSGANEAVADRAMRVLSYDGRQTLPVFVLRPGLELTPGTFVTASDALSLRDAYGALLERGFVPVELELDRYGGLEVTLQTGPRLLLGNRFGSAQEAGAGERDFSASRARRTAGRCDRRARARDAGGGIPLKL